MRRLMESEMFVAIAFILVVIACLFLAFVAARLGETPLVAALSGAFAGWADVSRNGGEFERGAAPALLPMVATADCSASAASSGGGQDTLHR